MALLDQTEKKVIIITLSVIALFVFSLLYAKDKYQTDVPECVPYDNAYEKPRIDTLDEHTYRVFAVAQMWQFQPAEIYIPTGSEVDFFLTSRDVAHGFNIADKNVNMMAVYGAVNKTSVRFDKPGIYKIVCHEYCGIGHQNMQAQVIVNYPEAQ